MSVELSNMAGEMAGGGHDFNLNPWRTDTGAAEHFVLVIAEVVALILLDTRHLDTELDVHVPLAFIQAHFVEHLEWW